MPLLYNVTGIASNSTSLVGLATGVNSLTSGWLFTFILIALYIISFSSFFVKTNDVNMSLMGSSISGFIIAVILTALNLVPNVAFYITLILASGITAFTYNKR